MRQRTELANMDEETKNKIKQLEDRIAKLETRRILQMDIMPQVVKSRHLDQVEMGLYSLDVNGVKRIGIGGTGQYLYKGNDGEIRLFSDLTTDGDIIVMGATTQSLRIYRSDGKFVFGDGAGGYDTNLYRESANALRTDDQLTVSGDIIGVGDIKAYTASKGLILKDRVTGTYYRLKITSGTLGIEAV